MAQQSPVALLNLYTQLMHTEQIGVCTLMQTKCILGSIAKFDPGK